MTEFVGFPKIARLNREIVVTEKIDGTNAQVEITEDGIVRAGSRNRYITPEGDNHGFAAWVRDNADDLRRLGPGRHFGEWWGSGIQSGYGLPKGEKRFSLFNVSRWDDDVLNEEDGLPARPRCCGVVPTLYRGPVQRAGDPSLHRAVGDPRLGRRARLHAPGRRDRLPHRLGHHVQGDDPRRREAQGAGRR